MDQPTPWLLLVYFVHTFRHYEYSMLLQGVELAVLFFTMATRVHLMIKLLG